MNRANKNVDEECPLCIEIMTGDSPATTALHCSRCDRVAYFSCIKIYIEQRGPRKCPLCNLEFLNVKEEWAMAQCRPHVHRDSWENVVESNVTWAEGVSKIFILFQGPYLTKFSSLLKTTSFPNINLILAEGFISA